MLARDVGGLVKVRVEVVARVDDVHGGSGEDVRGANEDGVADLVAELVGGGHRRELLPEGLVDAEVVEHARELVTVLGHVDHLGRGTEDLDALAVQGKGDVVRRLSSHRNDDSARRLDLVDVEDRLEADDLEVEAVGLVVVGTDRLGVVVDHDRLESAVANGPDRANGAPIELDGRSDAVDSRPEDHDSLVVERHVVLCGVVGHVEVVGEGGELGGDGVDLLDARGDAVLGSDTADGELVGSEELCELSVGESHLLRVAEEVGGDLSRGVAPVKEWESAFSSWCRRERAAHATIFSMSTMCSSLRRNHLSMLVSSWSSSTVRPAWKALAMAKTRLSEGFLSSSSISSLKSFCDEQGSQEPLL